MVNAETPHESSSFNSCQTLNSSIRYSHDLKTRTNCFLILCLKVLPGEDCIVCVGLATASETLGTGQKGWGLMKLPRLSCFVESQNLAAKTKQ